MGFGRGGGQMLGFSIDLRRHYYNTLALPCECVMTTVLGLGEIKCCDEINCNQCRGVGDSRDAEDTGDKRNPLSKNGEKMSFSQSINIV